MDSKDDTARQSIEHAIRQTKEAYAHTAEIYAELSRPFNENVMFPKIIALARKYAHTLEEKRVLDVGCGGGMLMKQCENEGADAYGVDITPELLKIARKRGLRRLIEASMHDLPFPDAYFDIAVSNFSIPYLPPEGQAQTLREIWRVLRLGGVLVYSCMHPFFMRAGHYRKRRPHYPSTIESYFQPNRQEIISMFGQTFITYMLDWPEILHMVTRAGFRINELVDADIPENLDELIAATPHEAARQFLEAFRRDPYGIFVVATK